MTAKLEQIAGAALSSLETVQASYDLAKLAIERGIPGDFVECGVFAGAQSAAMAKALLDHEGVAIGREIQRLHCGDDDETFLFGGSRHVHLFDTFCGIPQAGPHDKEFLDAGHAAGVSACPLAQVKGYMRDWGIPDELLVYHEGLFQDTVPIAVTKDFPLPLAWAFIDHIAVLRLDGDLYESTKVCMQYLYPLVSRGGWIIVDDWKLSGARKAVEEFVNPGPVYFRKD